jgi:hypothetical protein
MSEKLRNTNIRRNLKQVRSTFVQNLKDGQKAAEAKTS